MTSEGQIMITISTFLGEVSNEAQVSKFPILVEKAYSEGLTTIFYSEFGGTGANLNLAVGVKNRVYFEVVQKEDPTKLVKIYDIEIDCESPRPESLSQVKTYKDGRYFFEITPQSTE